MTSTRRRLYLATFLLDAGVSALIFAVGRQLAEENVGLLQMGWIGGGFAAGAAAVSIPAGMCSDRFGRDRIAQVGAFGVVIACLGCLLFFEQRTLLIAFYCLVGVSCGAIHGGVIAWLGEGESGIRAGRSRASLTLLIFCLSWNLGLMCGHFCGGVLFAVDPRAPMILAVVLTLCNFGVQMSLKHKSVVGPASDSLVAIPDDERELSMTFLRMCLIANIGGTCCMGTVVYLLPDLIVSLDIAPERHGTIVALMRVAAIAAYISMHKTSFWHHRFGVIVVVRTIALLGLALVCVAKTDVTLTLGLSAAALMLGFNYFASLYYSSTGSQDKERGQTCGLSEMTFAFGLAAGTVLAGIAGHFFGTRAPYILVTAIVAMLFLCEIVVFIRYVIPRRVAINED